MAEITGNIAYNKSVRGEEITTLDFGKLTYSYGRDYFSRYMSCVTGAGPNIVNEYGFSEENFNIANGTAKKILGIKPIELDDIRYGIQPIGTGQAGELTPGQLPLAVKLLVSRQVGKVFALDDKDLLDLGRSLPPIWDKALMQAYGKKIDQVISESMVAAIPSIVYDTQNQNAFYDKDGTRKFLAKYSATSNKTNFVYRDGDWTTPSSATVDEPRFTAASVYKIEGFFVDKGVSGYGRVHLQLTPAASNLLARTNEGLRMLRDGGTEIVRFVHTPNNIVSGRFLGPPNHYLSSAYNAGTEVATIAARALADDHETEDRVLFDSSQTMTAAALNRQSNLGTAGFVDIEVKRDDLIAVWAKDAVAFGEFDRLRNQASKNDIRLNNALFHVQRFGLNAVILDENKVMLFPIRGKNK